MTVANQLTDDTQRFPLPELDTSALTQAIWNSSESASYLVDVLDAGADFRFVAFNQACYEQCPVAVEELVGRNLSETFPATVIDGYLQHFAQCVQTQTAVCFEERLPFNGRETDWKMTVYPLANPEGGINQLFVMATDITIYKQKLAMVESRQLLQQVIDTLPAAIFWKDRNSTYLGCNQAFADIAGKESTQELIGKTDYDMVWRKEESDWFVECDRRVMGNNKPELNIIEPQRQANGRDAWLRSSKIPLTNDQNEVIGLLGIIEDLTDQKETADRQARLLKILEATPDIVGITDAEGNHRYLNRAGQSLFQLSPEDVSQLHLSDLTQPEIAEMIRTEAVPVAIEKGIWHGETTIKDAFNREIPVSHVLICHKSEEGETQYFSSIMRDISDRKAAEVTLKARSQELSEALARLKQTQAQVIQTEKMSGLGHMVAGIAHEINNPVNFIHANLQPADEYVKDLLSLIDLYQEIYPQPAEAISHRIEEIDLEFAQEDLPKLIRSMTMGTERIKEIVLSLRNFSRLDEAELKTVDLHEGINSTLVILNHRLKGTNIQLEKEYGNVPPVACYPSQLNQVFMNILSNAIDAVENQPNAKVTLTTASVNDTVQVRIKDNGPGIPADVQPYILDPFFTTKPVGKGTGMGMPISYQIVTEKHGGELTFSSTPGVGTEFVISLPTRVLAQACT